MTAIMKKTMKLYGAILSAIILAACSQKTELSAPGTPAEPEGARLFASIGEATKTYIGAAEGNAYKVRWNADDAINVNGVTVSNPVLSNDNLTAAFDGTGLEAPYRAVYPASAVVADSFIREVETDGNPTGYHASDDNYYDYVTVNVPEVQTYHAGTYDPAAAMIAASAEGSSLSFKQMTCFLKLAVSGSSSNIRRVTVRHGDLTKGVSGEFYFVFKNGEAVSSVVKSATGNITYDCGNAGVASGTDMFICIPARDYASGLIITAENMDGEFSSIKSDPLSLALRPGVMIPVALAFSATPAEKGKIRSANDWELFASDVNKGVDLTERWIVGGKVEIAADFSTSALTRVTAEWTYTLDGKNHTITQTAAKGPLFTDINGGTVKDLTLEGEMTDESVYIRSNPGYCTIARTLKGDGTISGITNKINFTGSTSDNYAFGSICRQVLHGTVSGCTNKGNINCSIANPTATKNTYAGGIVAIVGALTTSTNYLDGPVTISNCVNEGNISLVISSWSTAAPFHYNAAGGIVAWVCAGDATNYLTIENCSNTGNITNTRATSTAPNYSNGNAGGVIGCAYLPGSSCYYTKKSANWPAARSIACAYGDARQAKSSTDSSPQNYVDGVYFEMEDCTNSGKILLAAPSNSTISSDVLRMKQFAGGLIGVAFGMKDKHAKITGTGVATCGNTGTIDGGCSYSRSSYQAVNGGLIGLGGHVDIDGAYVGTSSTPAEIGKSYLSFANGGLFGIMISQCFVENCRANLTIKSACTGSTMKYYAALVGEIKGGTSSQGGLTKDATDATIYYAGSYFKNCKAKGTIYHGTALTGGTTETLSAGNIGDFLFCSYDATDATISAFDITGTGFWTD